MTSRLRNDAPPSIASVLVPSMTSTAVGPDSSSQITPPSASTDRPPGGTARSGGTKTPRKVQWAVERPALERVPSTHELDERGLDVSYFCHIGSLS